MVIYMVYILTYKQFNWFENENNADENIHRVRLG